MATKAVANRRRIIRRPRLTKLLDENSARIKLLIAPAGYGKTTLAQQWLSEPERQDVWYRGGPAAADVAALAAGLAVAASDVLPGAGKRMRERLRATGHPEEDVDILAELFAEDVQQWPDHAWLAVDDYQFAMESAASERFVDLLTQQTPLQLVVTSRRRPTWATARRILYGEIQEIDRRLLTMDSDEAATVLGRQPNDLGHLLDEARGWPAVLGLAALTDNPALPRDDMSTLEEFFSEEVLQSLEPRQLRALCILTIAGTLTQDLALLLLGEDASSAVESGLHLGILFEDSPGTFSIHPLLRRYLATMSKDSPISTDDLAVELVDFYLASRCWDEAFEVATRHSAHVAIPRVVAAALDALLLEGRLATLTRWLDHAFSVHIDDPVLDLADAEVAFRLNDHARAELLAAEAAESFIESPLVARSLVRAGYAAVLASREREALTYFQRARTLSVTTADKREALLGEYYAASELGDPSASQILAAAYALRDNSPEGRLRVEVMRLTHANRKGGLAEAVAESSSQLHLVSRVRDPLVTTAFLHALASGLNLMGRYDEALAMARQILHEAEHFRLELPIPHALVDKAIAELGLRCFDRVPRTLKRLQQLAPRQDSYLDALVTLVKTRLFLTQRNFEAALDLLSSLGRAGLSPPVRAEVAGCRALALAKLERFDDAFASLMSARPDLETSVEARVFVAGAELLCVAPGSSNRSEQAGELWELVQVTGNVDTFACIYRSSPEVLRDIDQIPGSHHGLMALLDRIGDLNFAVDAGLPVQEQSDVLTPREREVSELMVDGLSNQEIAAHLFISLATVKVHLRHIYEKLGVRNRAGAIAKLR